MRPFDPVRTATLCVVSLSVLFFSFWANGTEVKLRSMAKIAGPMILAGDIFHGAGDAMDLPVMRAPAPGKSIVLTPGQLLTLATYAGLKWESRFAPQKYIMTTESLVIDADRIRDDLAFALEDAGAVGPLDIKTRGRIQDIHIGIDDLDEISVDILNYASDSGQFSAQITVAPDSDSTQTFTIHGRAFPAMEIPVLVRGVGPSYFITEDDIMWVNMRVDRLPHDAATDMTQIVGMETRKPLRPGTALRTRYLTPPRLVKKNEKVILSYETGNLKLSTVAIAMKDGTKNETISFRNPESGRIIEATVTKPGFAISHPTLMGATRLAAR